MYEKKKESEPRPAVVNYVVNRVNVRYFEKDLAVKESVCQNK